MQRWALGLTLLAVAAGAALADSAEDERARLEAIRERIAEVKERMEADREARGDTAEALAETESRIGEIAARLHDLDKAIEETEQRIAELSARAKAQRDQLGERLGRLGEQIRAAYRVGRQGRLQLVLSQNDPAEVGRLLAYYEYYAEAQTEAVEDMRADLAALADTRTELVAERQRLQADREERGEVLARLEASRAEREETLAVIESRLSERGQKLESLRADAAELEKLIESLRENLADVSPTRPAEAEDFADLKGRLPPPVSGRVIAAFGDDKAGGRLSWQGVWLAAPDGAPVTAAAAGRVVYVGWMHRYGLIVVLDHGDDYYTVYGHNQSVYAEVGDWIRAGATIAGAGKSGGHDNSGVYFEIRRGRTPVNPDGWLGS